MTLTEKISNYLAAGYPILYVVTHEEDRGLREIIESAKTNDRGVMAWSITKGWRALTDNRKRFEVAAKISPAQALDAINKEQSPLPEETVFVLLDFHPYLTAPDIVRKMRDLATHGKALSKTLIVLSPVQKIPPELEKEITLVDYALPSKDQLGVILDGIVKSVGTSKARVDDREHLLEATRGLTWAEAENVLALALVQHKAFDDDAVRTVMHEKAAIIKKSGILEFYEPNVTMDNIGGLNFLKQWVTKRRSSFSEKARAYGLPAARGLLLVGVQGCGKSLSAKAISRLFNVPLIRLDVGRVFQGIVGESESNMRRALDTAVAIAPCVLWLDEMEKGLSGLQSSGKSDGGVTARVFGTFLTWMSEKTSPVFVIATVNDIDALPAELVRKGRFDEILFVDLPHELERREIFEIGLKEVNRDPRKFNLEAFAREADQFSGAEIKEAIFDAMHNAFHENAREFTSDDIIRAIKETSPLAVTQKEKVDALRTRANTSKWRNATEVIDRSNAPSRRVAVK
jgi:SpoVK/Ycf46/Vps4 family AAA+-type ATPase